MENILRNIVSWKHVRNIFQAYQGKNWVDDENSAMCQRHAVQVQELTFQDITISKLFI